MDVRAVCLRHDAGARRRQRVLRDSFDISPEYLSEDRGGADVQYDFFRYGQMGTRRFNALKLWMAFKFMGKRGYAETVERHLELTRHLAARLDELPDFERVGEIETAVCCFRYLPETVRALTDPEQDRVQSSLQQRIEKSGKAFFPSTILHGRRALRVNINSYLTERRHVDDLVELLQSEGEALLLRGRRSNGSKEVKSSGHLQSCLRGGWLIGGLSVCW